MAEDKGAFFLDRVDFVYPGSEVKILEDFSFSCDPQGIVVILGPSGCGKTTLLQQLALGVRAGVMYQEPRLIPWYTVEQNLAFALGTKEGIGELLEMVGLEDKGRAYPDQLSGGQRQRVSMARAFGFPCDGLLLDEPFQGLDLVLRYELSYLLLELRRKRPHPIIAITHDPREAALLSTDIRVYSGPPLKEIGRVEGHPDGPGIMDSKTLEIESKILNLLGFTAPPGADANRIATIKPVEEK